jgi:hypothetical protein
MKRLLPFAVLFTAAALPLNAIPDVGVPDSGSTFGLLAVAAIVVVAIRSKLR